MTWFNRLVARRWIEMQRALGLLPGDVHLTWNITSDYPHFKKPRGYGVTFNYGEPVCHMSYAPKILRCSPHRADGVVRHELGHVADFCIGKAALDRWAASRGVRLASTPELRADHIAEAVWQEPIRYDKKLEVQTTQQHGTLRRRPAHLGL